MTTHFVLVRHGICAQMDSVLFGRALDAPLDVRGARQALAIAEKLSNLEPHRTVLETSPRLRTRQTARAIAGSVRCPMNVSSVIDEVDYGRWAGCSFADLARDSQWQRWNEQRSRSATPTGETIAALQVRLLCYLDRLCTKFGDSTIVLVTHAEIIRSLLMHCLDVPIDDFQRIPVEPASLSFMHPECGRFVVTASNVRVHA